MPVDAELLDAAGGSLKVVANFAVGYDNVDLEPAASAAWSVTNTPDVLTNATAELVVALMLAAARADWPRRSAWCAPASWPRWEPGQLPGRELSGSVVASSASAGSARAWPSCCAAST